MSSELFFLRYFVGDFTMNLGDFDGVSQPGSERGERENITDFGLRHPMGEALIIAENADLPKTLENLLLGPLLLLVQDARLVDEAPLVLRTSASPVLGRLRNKVPRLNAEGLPLLCRLLCAMFASGRSASTCREREKCLKMLPPRGMSTGRETRLMRLHS